MQAAIERPVGLPVLGVNTYSYVWTAPLLDCVCRLGDLGYRVFEGVINPPHLDLSMPATERRHVAATLAARGLTLQSLNLPSLDHNLASPVNAMRDFSIGLFRDAIDLAADLAVPYLVTVPGRMNPLLAPDMALRQAWMHESMAALLPYAARRGVNLALENVPFAAFPDAQTLGEFVRSLGAGSEPVSICYDVANAHYIGESPVQGLRTLGDLVSLVHLSDTTRSTWRHDEVGQGDVPFGDLPGALQDMGFSGACMLEIIASEPESAILRSHQALYAVGFAAQPPRT